MRRLSVGLLIVLALMWYCPRMIPLALAGSGPDSTQPSPDPEPEPPPPPQDDPPPPAPPNPPAAYLYNIAFDEEPSEHADPDPTPGPSDSGASYITFYDIPGYVLNSAQGPSGWVVTVQNTGDTPPGATVSDDPTMVNLTFEYNSGAEIVGPSEIGTFSFESVYPDEAPGQFAGEDENANTGQLETSQGTVMLPVVPEPASATGAVVVCVGLLNARRARKRVRAG
jgi:hypothetical protein